LMTVANISINLGWFTFGRFFGDSINLKHLAETRERFQEKEEQN